MGVAKVTGVEVAPPAEGPGLPGVPNLGVEAARTLEKRRPVVGGPPGFSLAPGPPGVPGPAWEPPGFSRLVLGVRKPPVAVWLWGCWGP